MLNLSFINLVQNHLRLRNHLFNHRNGLTKYPKRFESNTIISTPDQTLNDVKDKTNQILGATKGFSALLKNRENLLEDLPENQDQLPTRSIKDSFDTALIPLSTNLMLQDKYTTLLGTIRKGRLMEDMDLFAVWICLKYIQNPKYKPGSPFPYTLVTAGVDQITFADWDCKVTNDMRFSGFVEWVGKTSLEVSVIVESKVHEEWKLFTKAYFIMVSRNSTNDGPGIINKLQPEGPEEEARFQNAQNRMEARKNKRKTSMLKVLPSAEEQKKIHEIFMKTMDVRGVNLTQRILPNNAIWMDSTKISNTVVAHPEDRNSHNTVFGGLIMRLSSELSWIVGYSHSKRRPVLKHICDIKFRNPIPMSSFIKMTGQVVFTEFQYSQVLVYCEIMDIVTNNLRTSNVFHYTYECNSILQEVVPKTYLEAIMWLEGRRHFKEAMKIKQ